MANSNLLSIALKCIPTSTGLVRVFNVTNAEILMQHVRAKMIILYQSFSYLLYFGQQIKYGESVIHCMCVSVIPSRGICFTHPLLHPICILQLHSHTCYSDSLVPVDASISEVDMSNNTVEAIYRSIRATSTQNEVCMLYIIAFTTLQPEVSPLQKYWQI